MLMLKTTMHSLRRTTLGASLILAPVCTLALSSSLAAQAPTASITTPKQQFGHNIGDDYWLANYDQFSAYWHKLAGESNRMKLVEIGKTEEGRPQLMAIISSPENMKHLARYKEIAERLAHAEGLTDAQAHALAKEGKAVVWIDGGLHASEVLGAHQLMQTVYDLVSRNDPETTRILNDVIVLAVHANPDGMQLVSNWYMKDADSTKRNTDVPRLWQKYTGHDNNRDFYMSNQAETKNINRVLYWEWFPQIVYNHHQTGPAGAVMFSPPFRDPFNYNFDPMIVTDLDLIGAAMHDRFNREKKPGVVTRSAAPYSTWWNGGLRTSPYFHNMIGLLTETIGNPTPQKIPFVPAMSLPRGDVPYPITPQEWHFRQSIDYSVTANYAVLDLASRQKDEFLYDIYAMGRNSIEKGNQNSWTISGSRIAAVDSAVKADQSAASDNERGTAQRRGVVDDKYFTTILHDPAKRDPRGYIIPADQPDFLTATKFVNTLRYNGVAVQRATAPFSVNGKQYPAGSFVVKTAQAFRPQVLDMFEPQDYPNDFAYPGGPPIRPYDNTGYTVAYQMGVQFDRILDGFDGPFQTVSGLAQPPKGSVANATGAAGFLFSHAQNDAFTVVNRLLKNHADVYWLKSPVTANGKTYPAGTFYVATGAAATPVIEKAARELGVDFQGTAAHAGADATKLRAPRLALWDTYGGSMPSGQIRWVLEQFEFPYTLVYPQDIDAGGLQGKFDALILPTGALSSDASQGRAYAGGARDRDVPQQYQHMTGRLSAEKSAPALKQFLEQGGTVLTIGSSTGLASMLGLPVTSALVEQAPKGGERALPPEKFYVPGSVLSVAVNNKLGVAAGAQPRVDVFYDNSPAFRLQADAASKGVQPVAWFDSPTPLRSGWAWGQKYLDGAVAIAEAKVGQGELYLFGPEITFRAQPHGTFRFLFNGIYAGGEKAVSPVVTR